MSVDNSEYEIERLEKEMEDMYVGFNQEISGLYKIMAEEEEKYMDEIKRLQGINDTLWQWFSEAVELLKKEGVKFK